MRALQVRAFMLAEFWKTRKRRVTPQRHGKHGARAKKNSTYLRVSAWVKEAGAAQGTSGEDGSVKAGGPRTGDRGRTSRKAEPKELAPRQSPAQAALKVI